LFELQATQVPRLAPAEAHLCGYVHIELDEHSFGKLSGQNRKGMGKQI